MLRFRVGPFPVVVHPSFFIAALLLGFQYGQPWKLAAWIFVVFVSVLVHELGHAVVGNALGGSPEIRLEGFGGATFPNLRKRPAALKQIALSVAGPVFGLLLGALALGLMRALPPDPASPAAWVVGKFMVTSVVWAAFNLLPLLPLDGGQVLLAAVEGVRGKPSVRGVAWFSAGFALALAAAAYFLLQDGLFVALFLAFFAFQNVSRARIPDSAAPEGAGQAVDALERADVAAAVEETRQALIAKDLDAALAAAGRLEHADGAFRQAAGLRLRAGVELARGDNEAAALFAGQSYSLFQSTDAAVVAARANLRAGDRERARNWLRRALEAGAPPAAVQQDAELSQLA